MYTILPIHQEKMPESFLFNTIEEAVEGAKSDFNDPHTPDTKGFMIVSIERIVGVKRDLVLDTDVEDYIMRKEELEDLIAKANEPAVELTEVPKD